MTRVRFAASPPGPLHLGDALSAAAGRAFGGSLLLRIDDLDIPGGGEAILGDLAWLGIEWDEGPVRQSERRARHAEAAAELGDGMPDRLLASVVDDLDLGITHVLGGRRPDEPLRRALAEALGATAPEYVNHGLILGAGEVTVASLRDAGIPAEAVRAYLDGLDLPREDVRFDLRRIHRLAIEAIGALPDAELAGRAGAPVELVPALRGARDLVEARDSARTILRPEPAALPADAGPTLQRFAELRAGAAERIDAAGARSIVRELQAVGGNLKALRLALTGRERGPELWAVVAALPRDEALRRVVG